MGNEYFLLLNAISDVMVAVVNVLGSGMVSLISGKDPGSVIVAVQRRRRVDGNCEASKQHV
jgi:hypothetical protein